MDLVGGRIMPMAFVLINVEMDGGKEVLENLKRIEEVKEAYSLFGVYDVIAKVEAEDRQRIEEIIVWKIRKFDKVRQTITSWVHAGFNRDRKTILGNEKPGLHSRKAPQAKN